jgi:hypothetical protein
MWIGFNKLMKGYRGKPCEYGNETSCLTKHGKLVDQMR